VEVFLLSDVMSRQPAISQQFPAHGQLGAPNKMPYILARSAWHIGQCNLNRYHRRHTHAPGVCVRVWGGGPLLWGVGHLGGAIRLAASWGQPPNLLVCTLYIVGSGEGHHRSNLKINGIGAPPPSTPKHHHPTLVCISCLGSLLAPIGGV
jgi:hypothetical protein